MPATWVAWPWSVDTSPGTTWPFRTIVEPADLPARSGWPKSTPPSITAMSAPAPVDAHHAAGKPAWVRPHWSPALNQGSLGAVVAAEAVIAWVQSVAQAIPTIAPPARRRCPPIPLTTTGNAAAPPFLAVRPRLRRAAPEWRDARAGARPRRNPAGACGPRREPGPRHPPGRPGRGGQDHPRRGPGRLAARRRRLAGGAARPSRPLARGLRRGADQDRADAPRRRHPGDRSQPPGLPRPAQLRRRPEGGGDRPRRPAHRGCRQLCPQDPGGAAAGHPPAALCGASRASAGDDRLALPGARLR